MNVGQIIESKLIEMGKNQVWLSNKLNINFKTLNGKINRSSFTWDELLKVAKVLNIDLNVMKNNINMEAGNMKQKVINIFQQIEGSKNVAIDINTRYLSGLIMIDELKIKNINDETIELSDNEDDGENLSKAKISFSNVDEIIYNSVGCLTISMSDNSEFIISYDDNIILIINK